MKGYMLILLANVIGLGAGIAISMYLSSSGEYPYAMLAFGKTDGGVNFEYHFRNSKKACTDRLDAAEKGLGKSFMYGACFRSNADDPRPCQPLNTPNNLLNDCYFGEWAGAYATTEDLSEPVTHREESWTSILHRKDIDVPLAVSEFDISTKQQGSVQ